MVPKAGLADLKACWVGGSHEDHLSFKHKNGLIDSKVGDYPKTGPRPFVGV